MSWKNSRRAYFGYGYDLSAMARTNSDIRNTIIETDNIGNNDTRYNIQILDATLDFVTGFYIRNDDKITI